MGENKNDKHKDNIDPIKAAVAGAVVGAGAAVAGTIAFKNNNRRKKVKDTLVAMKNKTIKYLEEKNGKNISKDNSEFKKARKKSTSTKHELKKPSGRVAVAQ